MNRQIRIKRLSSETTLNVGHFENEMQWTYYFGQEDKPIPS